MTDLPSNPLHPKILVLWRLATAVPVVLVCVGALGLAFLHPAFLMLIVVVAPIPFTVPDAWYRRWRYEIRERDVFLAHGLVVSSRVVVPFDRIQFVETSQGPLDRMMGLANVVIHTAGGSESIPGLTLQEAGRLREELARVAGTTSV